MIKIVEGNILDATEDIIGHQVNCQGVMGAGLAKQIRNKYPNVYEGYKSKCNNNDKENILGDCQIIVAEDGKFIANLFGQYSYGTGITQTNYQALLAALLSLKGNAQYHDHSVALPYGIGCGLAGGDWNIVHSMIQEVFKDFEVTLYKFK